MNALNFLDDKECSDALRIVHKFFKESFDTFIVDIEEKQIRITSIKLSEFSNEFFEEIMFPELE